MRIPRIFTGQALDLHLTVELEPDRSHYLANVLRIKPGAHVVLFNSSGHEFRGTVMTASSRSASVTITENSTPGTESPLRTVLGLGISRGERMDWAIQKSTELGVSVVAPLFTEYCEVRLTAQRAIKRQVHWQQTAISACEQCGRVIVPEILPPQPVNAWLEQLSSPLKLLLDQDQENSDIHRDSPGEVALLVGPEGGLSDNEKALALSKGFFGLKLGSRILRTETAPVAALALLQHWWGN